MRTETSGPSASRTFAGLTSRWTIPRACAWASPSRICAAASTARFVVELAALERVAERAAGDVLVGDVDVALVARERVGAQAGRVLELGGGGRLALRARAGGAGAGDDLERDLAVLALVEGVPDRAHPAAAERPQRPVAAEHEAVRSSVSRGLRHPRDTFPAGGRTPFGARGMGYECAEFRCKRA